MRLRHLAQALEAIPVAPPNREDKTILPSERTVRLWKANAPRFALLLATFPELRSALEQDAKDLAESGEPLSFLP